MTLPTLTHRRAAPRPVTPAVPSPFVARPSVSRALRASATPSFSYSNCVLQPATHPAGLEDPEAAQPVEPPDLAKPLWTHPSGVLFALSPLDHFQVPQRLSSAHILPAIVLNSGSDHRAPLHKAPCHAACVMRTVQKLQRQGREAMASGRRAIACSASAAVPSSAHQDIQLICGSPH